ncbi:MAG: PIN domain nuclease [Actinomycetota bacterium]|nr:PIN domain nuclease [Actinomycetota bacterium]
MIVVDTSVWIDVINEVETPVAARCVDLLGAGAPVALTDVILTEVLQGFRTEREANAVERHLRSFPLLRLATVDDFALAARLYRQARRAGVTIRKTLDCLIAAPCVRDGVPLLHRDEDFDRLASCTELEIFA